MKRVAVRLLESERAPHAVPTWHAWTVSDGHASRIVETDASSAIARLDAAAQDAVQVEEAVVAAAIRDVETWVRFNWTGLHRADVAAVRLVLDEKIVFSMLHALRRPRCRWLDTRVGRCVVGPASVRVDERICGGCDVPDDRARCSQLQVFATHRVGHDGPAGAWLESERVACGSGHEVVADCVAGSCPHWMRWVELDDEADRD